jgi:hypothetical protein
MKHLAWLTLALLVIGRPSPALSQPVGYAQLKETSLSCVDAQSSLLAQLRAKKAYIPFLNTGFTGGRKVQMLMPRPPEIDSNLIRSGFFDIPSARNDALIISLAGEANYLWYGIMSSPSLLAKLSAEIMSACPNVGLIEYRHWWEEVVYVGYFSDNSARLFKDTNRYEESSKDKFSNHDSTLQGKRRQWKWGYCEGCYPLNNE